MKISSTIKGLFTKARLLDSGFPVVALNESEICSLLALICRDLGWDSESIGLPVSHSDHLSHYFELPMDWFSSQSVATHMNELQECLARAIAREEDFGLYFHCLCSLHKRRLKYQRILSHQPMPTMDQVGPRVLLEHGIAEESLLRSWMVWRKWIFDIDNRAGQETGYLFEPILASCIGGEAIGASQSPVKRLDEAGQPKSSGRQVDCYLGAENAAYEFKIRVTIAASGQGRFGEELSFARECKAAGITPILIVLDPTPSSRLDELIAEFRRNEGFAYVGENAWAHLREKSGIVMARFIENYVQLPIQSLSEGTPLQPAPVALTWTATGISIEGNGQRYEISR